VAEAEIEKEERTTEAQRTQRENPQRRQKKRGEEKTGEDSPPVTLFPLSFSVLSSLCVLCASVVR
jgi:hypothetical protein